MNPYQRLGQGRSEPRGGSVEGGLGGRLGQGRSEPRGAHSLHGLSRRHMLYGGGLVVVSATTSGCGLFSTDPDSDDTPGGDKGLEAPMLAERVEAGELPPVEERLPVNPMVVEPTERVGVYGGTWNTALTDSADGPWLHRTVGYQPLMRWNREWTEAIPNVAESIEPNEDASEFTIRLREGMKWSDGELLTTDDVVWGYENVVLNRDLNPEHPGTLQRDGEPAEVEALDELTFVVRFNGPKADFVNDMARQIDGQQLIYYPRHYLEQFHIDFNENADEEAQANEFDDWAARFIFLGAPFNQHWENPELPSLNAWLVVDPLGEGNQVVFERNPYFFKVDPEGSQLPYIDEVRYDFVPEEETKLLQATQGAYDFHSRHFNTLANQPVVVENQEAGNYRLLELESSYSTDMAIAFNMNHENAAKRRMFQDRDFRIALSHAINRQRLIDTVWQRQGEPSQPAPRPESRFYDEEFANQYTEYDPDLADQTLDDAGYDERDSDGYRLRPDGERVSLTFDVTTEGIFGFWVDAVELVAEDWEAVGVEVNVNALSRDAFEARHEAEVPEHDVNIWAGEGGRGDETIFVQWYLAAGPSGGALWAKQWSNWYDARGEPEIEPVEEPPEIVLEQHRLYDQFLAEPDPDARDELFRQILAIAKEQFWGIGTVRAPGTYAIVSNSLHNVGDQPLPEAATFNTPAPANPEQWFIEEEE